MLNLENVVQSGTIFYRKRVSQDEILETLALLAEGNRISSLTRVKGHKEDTILKWLREAASHATAVEEVLLKEYHIKRGQLDGLWLYVGNKGKKRLSRNVGKRPIHTFDHDRYGNSPARSPCH